MDAARDCTCDCTCVRITAYSLARTKWCQRIWLYASGLICWRLKTGSGWLECLVHNLVRANALSSRNESTSLQVLHGLLNLGIGIHNDWPVPCHWLADGSARDKQKSQAVVTGRDHHFIAAAEEHQSCLLYTSPSPRDQRGSRMPSSA